MNNKINHGKDTVFSNDEEYRISVKNLIQKEVGDIIDEEIRKAARDII